MALEEGEIVLCTVDRVIGTNVFVKIENKDKEIEGCIVMSEVAPGRIRNIRDYVFPKKKIICKVLRISGDRVDLSLRRVTPKEQKELREKNSQEKSYENILKSVLGEKARESIETVSKGSSLYDFLSEARENSQKLEEVIGKDNAKKVLEIISSQQKSRKFILKKEISLTTTDPLGMDLIKKILGKVKDTEIKYISAGRYVLKTESEDAKKTDNELKNILSEIEKDSKRSGVEFSIAKK